MKKRRLISALLALVFICSAFASGCSLRPKEVPAVSAPAVATPSATEEPAGARYTVTYTLDGETISTETVIEGHSPSDVPAFRGDRGIVSWKDANGTETDVWARPVSADTVYQAVLGPELVRTGAYMAPESDGLFHALNKFTRSDAARAVYNLFSIKPSGETFLKDVTTRARCYQAATTLVTAGYMELDEGKFHPDVAITRVELTDLLSRLFSRGAVLEAMSRVPEPMNRGEAAAVINTLLGLTEVVSKPYFPDVSPAMDCFAAVECAGIQDKISWLKGDRAEPGFINLEGYLYYVGQDGYFVHDTMIGTLYFDAAGRYTSGDEAVDKYVADIIDANTKSTMSREEMLRALYIYVRDHYLYLKRSLYAVGETGWELSEALVMFQTGKGNCYNFSGAFWALARGIGYDAVCYSGLVGKDRDPHSWVEIEFDGVPYIYDVETEMSMRLLNDYVSNLYKQTYEQGKYWSYAWEPYDD